MKNLREMNVSMDSVSADLDRIADSLERMVAIFERAEDSIRGTIKGIRKVIPFA